MIMKPYAESAEKVSSGILNAIDRLAMFPDYGSPTPDEWLNAQGYQKHNDRRILKTVMFCMQACQNDGPVFYCDE